MMRQWKWWLLASVILGAASGLANISVLYWVNEGMRKQVTKNLELMEMIQTYVLPFAAVLLGGIFAGLLSQFTLGYLSEQSTYNLRLKITRHVMSSPLRDVENIGASSIYSILAYDAQTISAFLQAFPNILVSGVTLLAGSAYLAWLNPRVALFSGGFMIFGVLMYHFLSGRGMSHFLRARKKTDAMFANFHALTGGVKELKLNRLRRSGFLQGDYQPVADALKHHNVTGGQFLSLSGYSGHLTLFSLIGLLVFFPFLVVDGSSDFASSVLVILYLTGPLDMMLNLLPMIGRLKIAMQRIDRLGLLDDGLVTRSEAKLVQDPQVSGLARTLQGPIELKDVEFSYVEAVEEQEPEQAQKTALGTQAETALQQSPPKRKILHNINLVLAPKELVFLIGGNGSGKSTLLKVLTGLYSPESGSVCYAGKKMEGEEPTEEYRQLFSTIFSDFHLFSRMPHPLTELDRQQVDHYLKDLDLSSKVEVEDDKFSTIALSQGQKKRLALLVSYLEDRPVYIFDEWAADQDPEYRHYFYTRILPRLRDQGKTILVVTHDDRYFPLADRVLKLDGGYMHSLQSAPLSPAGQHPIPETGIPAFTPGPGPNTPQPMPVIAAPAAPTAVTSVMASAEALAEPLTPAAAGDAQPPLFDLGLTSYFSPPSATQAQANPQQQTKDTA